MADNTFGGSRPLWLDRLDKVRNVVRQEMIARQLDKHLCMPPAQILDVGAGQGTQSIRLARKGHQVLAVEPDPDMRAAFSATLTGERAEVRDRVIVRAGSVDSLALVTRGELYDAVLLLGVLMYMPASGPIIAELAARVAPGGILALAARTTTSAVWRPAARQDWQAALAAFDEYDLARTEGRDMRYVNEIGASARADVLDALISTAATCGLELESWYGVRIAVDPAELDPPPPSDPRELAALLDVEERLGATDPYRQLGQLAHLILRRTSTAATGKAGGLRLGPVEHGGPDVREGVDERFLAVERRRADGGQIVEPFAEPGQGAGDGSGVVAGQGFPGARVGVELGEGRVGEALHLFQPQGGQPRVGAPVLHDGPQDGRAGLPELGSAGDAGAQCGGRISGGGQPGRGDRVSLPDRPPDQFTEYGVLAVEVEVEAAAGDSGRVQDVIDRQAGEGAVGEQPGGGVQDGLA
jgi:S-adenosylmethionine-dependent methyltransferase